jgi:hypothetical protein
MRYRNESATNTWSTTAAATPVARLLARLLALLPALPPALLTLLILQPLAACAAEVRLLVQHSALAGFRYYEAAAVFEQLRPGEPLTLVHERDNSHDANAVRVDWRGHKLGYVPRRQNAALAWALDRGQALEARVAERRIHPNPRRRIEFDVFAR